MATPALELHPYQKRWIQDQSRFKAGMFARQTGKTFATTLEIAKDVMEHEARGQRTRWVILSRGERQAREAMEEGLKLHLKAYNVAIRELVGDFRTPSGTFQSLDVELPNGSRISALPANPDTARGYSANVFLDEFAIHKDSRAIWGALFPVISKQGLKLRVTSTPNGKGNKFYEIMTTGNREADLRKLQHVGAGVWSLQFCDIYQAVADGLDRDIEALKEGLGDPDLWAQEYELQWLDEASAWLSYNLINGVEDPSAGLPDLYEKGETFIGNDIGRRKDLWIAWVWERVGDVLWCREIRKLHRKSFAEQDAVLDELVDTYNPRRIAMDQTGMGEKPVEDAKRRYGEYRVEGVQFTSTNKHNLATLGKQAFEDRTVRIPQGDRELREDLHKLRKTVTPMGNVRFDAESDSAGHADRTWAAFLGIYAATEFTQPAAGASVESEPEVYVPERMAARRRAAMFGRGRWRAL